MSAFALPGESRPGTIRVKRNGKTSTNSICPNLWVPTAGLLQDLTVLQQCVYQMKFRNVWKVKKWDEDSNCINPVFIRWQHHAWMFEISDCFYFGLDLGCDRILIEVLGVGVACEPLDQILVAFINMKVWWTICMLISRLSGINLKQF